MNISAILNSGTTFRKVQPKTNIRSYDPLSNEQLMRYVPSIFADEAHESRSDRYTYIPTIQVIDSLRNEGFFPFAAMQCQTRKEGHREFTKHIVRLRHANQKTQSGNENEIVLVNSHDGSSSYRIMAGSFRLVCSNGMIHGDINQDIRVRHSGDVMNNVIEGAVRVLDEFEVINEERELMRSITLDKEEREILARTFLDFRYDDPLKPAPVTESQLLSARRKEDKGNDLWSTFNVIQENTIKGGLMGKSVKGTYQRTRAVKGIDQDLKLNQSLWMMAQKMAKLKLS